MPGGIAGSGKRFQAVLQSSLEYADTLAVYNLLRKQVVIVDQSKQRALSGSTPGTVNGVMQLFIVSDILLAGASSSDRCAQGHGRQTPNIEERPDLARLCVGYKSYTCLCGCTVGQD